MSDPVVAHATRQRVGWRFISLYALAYAGTWLALLTPVLVSIALRVRELEPDDATGNLALVLGIGALFAMFANPLFGRLSDRTTSALGMRRPWIVGGFLAGSAALMMIAQAPNVFVVLLGWCLAQISFNAVLAAILAVLPDQVPVEQRGTVAGVLGICQPIGQVAGTFLVQAVSPSMPLIFLTPAAIGLAAVALLAWRLPDRRLAKQDRPAFKWRELLSTYWVDPQRHPDFAWAWLSRFLFVIGSACLNTYHPYYLMDKLGRPEAEVPQLIFRAILLQGAIIITSSLIAGKLSDLVARRKVFVFGGAMLYATGLWLVAGAESYSIYLFGIALTGLGHGAYFAVDLALVADVLPDRRLDAAKDLGIMNIANALPQSVAPAIGPLILWLGGDYGWIFVTAGLIACTSSLAILPVRRVK